MKLRVITGIIVSIIAIGLTACGEKSNQEISSQVSEQPESDKKSPTAGLTAKPDVPDSDSPKQGKAEWPQEFAKWEIPIIEKATVTLSDNRSSDGDMMTQGVNAIVNLANVTKADFDSYCGVLIKTGFSKDPSSLDYVIMVYTKSVEGGIIKLTLSYTDDTTTIIANNSAAASDKDAQSGGSPNWPKEISGIPEFTKGKFKETVDMGGNMFMITYNKITDKDIKEYKALLMEKGFKLQDQEGTEGYMKMDTNAVYSVGFVRKGDQVQLVIAVGTY